MSGQKHSWVGMGGSIAHCQWCRIGFTKENEYSSCEGTCICECGHHTDEHYPGPGCGTGRHRTPAPTPCECTAFKRAAAVWEDGRGWVVRKAERSA